MGPKRIAFRCEICGVQMSALQIHAHVRTHRTDVPAFADKKHVPTIKLEENSFTDPSSVNATNAPPPSPSTTSTSTVTTTSSGAANGGKMHQQFQFPPFPPGMPGYPWMPTPGMGMPGAPPGFFYPGLAQAMMPPMHMYPYHPYASMMYQHHQPMPPVQTKMASYIQTQDPQNGGGDTSISNHDISLTTGSSFEAVFKVPASAPKHHRRSTAPSVEDLTGDLDEAVTPSVHEVVIGTPSDQSDEETNDRKRRRKNVEPVATAAASTSSYGSITVTPSAASADQPSTSSSTNSTETISPNQENQPAETIVQVSSYKCDLCEAQFTSTVELVSHVNSSHNVLTYECDVCGKKFARRASVSAHKGAAHRASRSKTTIAKKNAEAAAAAVREPSLTPAKSPAPLPPPPRSTNSPMPKLSPAKVTPSKTRHAGPPILVSEVSAAEQPKPSTSGLPKTFSKRFSGVAGLATATVVPTRVTRVSASVSPVRKSTRVLWAQAREQKAKAEKSDKGSEKTPKQVHPCPHCDRKFRDYDGLKGHAVYCQARTSVATSTSVDSTEANSDKANNSASKE